MAKRILWAQVKRWTMTWTCPTPSCECSAHVNDATKVHTSACRKFTAKAAKRKQPSEVARPRNPSALQHDQQLPLVLRDRRNLARRIRRLRRARTARKDPRRLLGPRTPRVLARQQDAVPAVLALVRGSHSGQDVVVNVQVVVGAQDVGFC